METPTNDAPVTVEQLRTLYEAVEAGKFDAIDAVADQWIESAGIVGMCNAIASVFEKHAPQEIMDRFRAKLADMMHLAFVEGAANGVLNARPALAALASAPAGDGVDAGKVLDDIVPLSIASTWDDAERRNIIRAMEAFAALARPHFCGARQ